jgi:hypothetical protein
VMMTALVFISSRLCRMGFQRQLAVALHFPHGRRWQ